MNNQVTKLNMKMKFLNILILSIIVTIFGFLMDDDLKEPSTIMRFVEFFAMIGIVYIIISFIYFSFNFIKNKIIPTNRLLR